MVQMNLILISTKDNMALYEAFLYKERMGQLCVKIVIKINGLRAKYNNIEILR